jgi:hypothetical protein
LVAQQRLEEEYHRFGREQPRLLSGDERASIRQLATDIPSLWSAPTTKPADRKEIIRQVVERVLVDAEGTSERVRVRMNWIGGGQTNGEVMRPVGKLSDLSSYPRLREPVRHLTKAGWAATAIADQLNREGYHPTPNGA